MGAEQAPDQASFEAGLVHIQHAEDQIYGAVPVLKKTVAPFDFVAGYTLQVQLQQRWKVLEVVARLQRLEGNCEWLQHYSCASKDMVCGMSPLITLYFSYYKYTLQNLIREKSIKSKPFKESELLHILSQLVMVLRELQLAGFVHGLVKPESVYIDQLNQPRLRINHLARPGNHQEYVRKGRAFVSPEESQGNVPTAPSKCDVFALGVTMLEAVNFMDCYVLLYRNRRPQQRLIIQQLSAIRQSHPSLVKFLEMMLAWEPDQRADFCTLSQLIKRSRQSDKENDSTAFAPRDSKQSSKTSTGSRRQSIVKIKEVKPLDKGSFLCP